MNLNKSDVLVIGGGAAGCVVADVALDAGKSVTMVFPNGGSSEIAAGALDVMGVVPGEAPKICDNYMDGVDALLNDYPEHVYKKSKANLQQGIDSLTSLAAAGGYSMTGFTGNNVWVPNMMGTFSIFAYVPEMMKESVVDPGKEEKVLVVGIKGNVAFNAQAAAVSYQKYQKKLSGKATYFSTEIKLEGWGDRRKISDGELADYVDTADGIDELVDAIKTFCSNNRYQFDKILLPPTLGYIHYQENVEKIRNVCGCSVGEVAAIGNSVVGYRFTRALYKGLAKKGANLLKGTVAKKIAVTDDGVKADCVIGLTDQLHPGKSVTLEAKSMVLATGGFVGGGIKARKTEVWVELLDEKLGVVKPEQLDRNVVNRCGQDFIRMGVETNDDMSVADEKFKKRIFACGNILAGQNFASERSGAGIAVSSAYLAGKNAASV